MIISNEEKAAVLILHLDEIAEGAEVIAQVKVAGRPYAAEYCFHGHKSREIFRSQFAVRSSQFAVCSSQFAF